MRLHFNRQLSQCMKRELMEQANPFLSEWNWLENAKIEQYENVYVFDRFKPKGKLRPRPGEDETGIECSLNHFHFACPSIELGVALSVVIFEVVSELWHESFGIEGRRIRQIISLEPTETVPTAYGGTYRFHSIRENQSWLSSNLEHYEEIVLVCE